MDLGALVQDAARQMSDSLAEGDPHTIQVDVPAEPLMVLGDDLRLEQVLTNLLSNALKYSPERESVLVQACPRGAIAELRVIGVADAVERFGQALGGDRFQQIVDGVHREGFDRVLGIGRNEDDDRWVFEGGQEGAAHLVARLEAQHRILVRLAGVVDVDHEAAVVVVESAAEVEQRRAYWRRKQAEHRRAKEPGHVA
mgnify:CR=1 FL=1